MTQNTRTTDPTRKTALIVGVLFIITFITAIGAALLYGPIVDDPRYIFGPGADAAIGLGAVLELILIITMIGTALYLYPLLRRQNEVLALGYVAVRIIECVFIGVGLLALLAAVTLRQQVAAGADPGSLVGAAHALVAVNRWTFVLGPGFMTGVGTGLIVGWLMYRSGLISRRLSLLGLAGGTAIVVTGAAIVLGVIERGSIWQNLAVAPEFIWESAVLGLLLIVRGFNRNRAPELDRRDPEAAPAYAAA